MAPSSMLMPRPCGLCSLSASVPCSVAPEKSVCRPQPPQVRRTFSLDTILSSYLLGQWPRDADGAFTCCTNDKATQVMGSRRVGGLAEATGDFCHRSDLSWVLGVHRSFSSSVYQGFSIFVFVCKQVKMGLCSTCLVEERRQAGVYSLDFRVYMWRICS